MNTFLIEYIPTNKHTPDPTEEELNQLIEENTLTLFAHQFEAPPQIRENTPLSAEVIDALNKYYRVK